MPADRSSVGMAGESVAARFLRRRGVAILDRNVRVGRDEIDLIARTPEGQVAVEVKTGLGSSTRPWENFDDAKRVKIQRAARALGIHRVDLVTVELTADGAIVRWLPDTG